MFLRTALLIFVMLMLFCIPKVVVAPPVSVPPPIPVQMPVDTVRAVIPVKQVVHRTIHIDKDCRGLLNELNDNMEVQKQVIEHDQKALDEIEK